MDTSAISRIRLLLATNKTNPLKIDDFDYIEGKTKEEELVDSLKMRNKRYYENPLFWLTIIGLQNNTSGYSKKTIQELVDIVINPIDQYNAINQEIMEMFMFQNIFNPTQTIVIYDNHVKDKNKHQFDLNRLLSVSMELDDQYYKELSRFDFEDTDGTLFLEACRNNKTIAIDDLIKMGVDPKLNNSLGFILLVKHGDYTNALKVLDYGADIHTMNDLAYRSFLVNDGKRFCKKGEEASHNEIMHRFKEADCRPIITKDVDQDE